MSAPEHEDLCMAVAWIRAEQRFRDESDVRAESSAAIDHRALVMLGNGDVICTCTVKATR